MVSRVVENRPPWIHRRFIKDKVFTRERYWRKYSDNLVRGLNESDEDIFIPDAKVWRKYLKLFASIAENHSKTVRLVLLESVVEFMDWRNTAAVVDGRIEAAAIQERNRLKKMLESNQVVPFCDLSVREEETDEFDILQYTELTIESRAYHALLRAGRLLLNQKRSMATVVVLDDDLEIHQSHAEESLQIVPISQFLTLLESRGIVGPSDLQELATAMELSLAEYQRRNNPNDGDGEDKSRVDNHLSEEEAQKGLKRGNLIRGKLDVTTQNVKEALVKTSKGRFFVNQQLGHFNRALHQDIVALEPLPESQWGCPVGKRRLVHHTGNDEDDEETAGQAEGTPVPSARVVAIIQPSRRKYVATLVDSPSSDERAVIVVPMDIRIPKIRIQTRSWQRFLNQRLLVQIDEWEPDSNYPSGHCVEILGPVGDLETEIKCLLEEHEIRLEPFSASALASLPVEGPKWQVPKDEVMKRRDLRGTHRIFSVDPVGCQDIDDTMHARVLKNGDVEVGVHIADVTHFVPHNSALDKEAQVRGTTFYLVDRRFDMLPSLLSSDLCSLHGDTDRLAVSVIWTMSADFKQIKSTWYGRTVIHNCQAMTYEQAHNILHNAPPDEPNKPLPPPLTAGYPVRRRNISPLKKDLQILTNLARKLRKDREEIGGAVDLSSGDSGSELKFVLDRDGNPTKVAPKKDLEIHHTIAELMIFANQSVASKIYNHFPDTALLRIHRTVEEDRFEDLQTALKAAGAAFDGRTNMSLAKSLKEAKQDGSNNSVVNAFWQSLATRAMSEALYICTGRQQPGVGLSHYGLGIEKYTHFTSPIRRYADVVVHKQLLLAVEGTRHDSLEPPPGFAPRKALSSIPDSSAISIMKGEGLQETEINEGDDYEVASLAQDVRSLQVNQAVAKAVTPISGARMIPYAPDQVASICDSLNQQNRMAKLSSMECQRLFLSLYFRGHIEETKAVVTDLRVNGFLVYVPKFDLKAPIFISDKSGNVQLDPELVGLSAEAGLDATLGFSKSGRSRRFPVGSCSLSGSGENATLEVAIPEATKRFRLRVLDVVNVHIFCDFTDVKARVPPPRLHLVAKLNTSKSFSSSTKKHPITSSLLSQPVSEVGGIKPQAGDVALGDRSIYQHLHSYPMERVLDASVRLEGPNQSDASHCQPLIPGRKVFSGYINPDTRTAIQQAAADAASDSANQRRAAAMASHASRNEYETTAGIERMVTSRAQKLLAGKRNARKAKAK